MPAQRAARMGASLAGFAGIEKPGRPDVSATSSPMVRSDGMPGTDTDDISGVTGAIGRALVRLGTMWISGWKAGGVDDTPPARSPLDQAVR